MFNLEKHSQGVIPQDPIEGDITGAFNDLGDQYEGGDVEETSGEIIDAIDQERQQLLLRQAKNVPIWQYFMELENEHPDLIPDIEAVKTQAGIQRLEDTMNPASIQALHEQLKEADMEATGGLLGQTPDVQFSKSTILNAAMKARSDRMRNMTALQPGALPLAAFNLKRRKEAQMENMGASRFPVANVGDFITKFADDLLAWDGDPGTPGSEAARLAYEEIRDAVSPGFEEEANSILETIIELDPTMERDKAEEALLKIFNVMLAPMAKDGQPQEAQPMQPMQPMMEPMQPMMEPVMSEKNPEGIVRYNLTDHILNNPPTENMTKTAADQFGQQYLLYGPTEKRICPKLRGKNLSVGDVVSEYTCRHHCIDGICIDDNKTICGEALWRANAMDKFSREYVDEDGNIQGGYLNKRFEINRNVPEENKMRLKPGETRKPRPASQGNLESRMQDMRNKEGKARDYRPNTDTSKPFEWCHDVDQNNVEASQSERDKREEAAGHQTVQYTNRDQGENNPKKGFNLKGHKTAEAPHPHNVKVPLKETVHNPTPSDKHHPELNPAAAKAPKPADIDPRQQTFDSGKAMKKKRSFNLQEIKEAKSPPGFKHTVEHMKSEHGDEVDNPFALAWWMKNKGYKSHKGPGDVEKCSVSSVDIQDVGVKDTHVQALLHRKHVSGKPIGMPTSEKVADSKKKT